MDQLRAGIAAREAHDTGCYSTGFLGALGEVQSRAGQPQAGLSTLDEALARVEETDERFCAAELHRMRAELLLSQSEDAEAEVSFHRSIDVARRQEARSWELRATTGLARLWKGQGKETEARQVLAGIYDWFTEGLDTPDLVEAKALLDELSGA
jgi:predicted ATPase